MDNGNGLMWFFSGGTLFFTVFVIAAFVFWVVELINCLKRDFEQPNDKIIWVVVVAFLYVLGAIIYYFVVVRTGKYDKKVKISEIEVKTINK